MTVIALQNRDLILDRVSNGDELHDIAKDLGIKPPNISKYLASDPDYKEARQIGVRVRLNRARKALEEMADLGVDKESKEIIGISQWQSNLARVRAERLKSEEWFAEREFPEIYGQKQQLMNVQAIQVVVGGSLFGVRAQDADQHRISTESTQVIESKDL